MPLFWLLLILLHPRRRAPASWSSPSRRGSSTRARSGSRSPTCAALTGGTAVALVNSLWVSCAAAALGARARLPDRLAGGRTTLPGRRLVPGGMWLVLLLPSWLPALGWERLVEPDGVMYRIGLDCPFVTHAILGPFGVVLLLGLRCVPFTLPGDHRRAGRARPGVRGRRAGPRREPRAGDAAHRADPRPGHLVGAGDRLRRVGQRLRRGRDARLQLELLARHLSAVRGHRQLPAELPGRRGDGLAAGRGRGHPARPAGPGAARPSLRGAVRAHPAGRPPPAQPPAAVAAAAGVGLFFAGRARRPGLRRGERLAAGRLRRLVHPDPGQLPRGVPRRRSDRAARALARSTA